MPTVKSILPVPEAVVAVNPEKVASEVEAGVPLTWREKSRRYSADMHAYTTVQSDIAKKAVLKRGPLTTANSNGSAISTSSELSDTGDLFPIVKTKVVDVVTKA